MNFIDLRLELEKLIEGLLFLSESDYPFVIETTNPAQIDLSQATAITITDFLQNAATEKEWHDSVDKQIVVRYQNLLNFLTNDCNIVGVYKTEPPLATIYIILQASAEQEPEQYIVLSTQVVET